MTKLALVAVAAISASGVARAAAQYGAPAVLQPTTYSSPSGAYELFVDPSERLGGGPGRYRMTRDRAEVWSGEKPFTFWEATVTDDGIAAGYAYTRGEEGWGDDGEIVVAILSATGALMREDRTRRSAVEMHAPPVPRGRGLFVQPAVDQLVVRVHDREYDEHGEEWWSYRLSTGEALAKARPRTLLSSSQTVRWCNGARPVAGTPLVLTNWWLYDLKGSRTWGGLFALVDSASRPLWTLSLPGDYTIADDDAAEVLLAQELRGGGALLDTDTPGSFEIRHVAARARVRYSVVADRASEGGWRVEEIGRSPHEPPKDGGDELAPAIKLVSIGSSPMRAEGAERGAIRDVLAFAFDPDGSIEFVRTEEGEPPFTIVSLDAAGAVERETPVRPIDPKQSDWGDWTRLSDGTWLVITEPAEEEETGRAWRVDGASGASTELTDFRSPGAEDVEPSPDGGFVVKATYDYEYFLHGAVLAFDAAGRRRWELRESLPGDLDPSSLHSPEDVAVLPDGSVAVLEQSVDRLHLLGPDGAHRRTIELEAAWGQEPNYVSGITADGEGVLIHDFNGDPPLWRMAADGEVRARLTPRFPDARSPGELSRRARVAPDGRIWTTDGSCFLRIGDDGVIDRIVGNEPDANALTEVEATAIDGLGRVLVQDERTGAVHVFDPDGTRRFVCRPGPADFPSTSSIDELVAHGDGGVLAELPEGRYSYVRFGPDGSRIGTLELGDVASCARGSSEIWAEKDDELLRIGASGEVLQRIPRRADGRWFEAVDDVAVGPGGSVAVLDIRTHFGFAGSAVVASFAADGSPVRTFDLPPRARVARIAHGGRWIALSRWGSDVLLLDTEDGSVHAFDVPGMSEANSSWAAGFSADGSEFWMLQSPQLVLHRFRLP